MRPLKTVALYLSSQAQRNFINQSSPDGVPWAPFKRKPSKRRGGPNAKLLRDTDLMMASLTGQGTGHVENVLTASLVWGTSITSPKTGYPYPACHQFGAPRANIPPRPFIGITASMLTRIEDILVDSAARQLAGGAP